MNFIIDYVGLIYICINYYKVSYYYLLEYKEVNDFLVYILVLIN